MSDFHLVEKIRDFCKSKEFSNSVAVTLTLKQCVDNRYIDNQVASDNLRHFLNRLNHSVFKNAAKRYGKKLNVIPVLEKDATHRFHYHLQIEKPERIDSDTFQSLISSCWETTPYGYKQIEVKFDADRGWTNYILKRRSKDDFSDCIDWVNFHYV